MSHLPEPQGRCMHKELEKSAAKEFGFPVDAQKVVEDETMGRVLE